MSTAITIPLPDEIRQRIDVRRREIAELKQILRLSQAAEKAARLNAECDGRKELSHAGN